ncbi:hypothetical protein BDW66DRAFT_126943 [Aspergillus desertorum]
MHKSLSQSVTTSSLSACRWNVTRQGVAEPLEYQAHRNHIKSVDRVHIRLSHCAEKHVAKPPGRLYYACCFT